MWQSAASNWEDCLEGLRKWGSADCRTMLRRKRPSVRPSNEPGLLMLLPSALLARITSPFEARQHAAAETACLHRGLASATSCPRPLPPCNRLVPTARDARTDAFTLVILRWRGADSRRSSRAVGISRRRVDRRRRRWRRIVSCVIYCICTSTVVTDSLRQPRGPSAADDVFIGIAVCDFPFASVSRRTRRPPTTLPCRRHLGTPLSSRGGRHGGKSTSAPRMLEIVRLRCRQRRPVVPDRMLRTRWVVGADR